MSICPCVWTSWNSASLHQPKSFYNLLNPSFTLLVCKRFAKSLQKSCKCLQQLAKPTKACKQNAPECSRIACSYISLHAVPWAYMKFHELACSSFLFLSSSFAVLVVLKYICIAIRLVNFIDYRNSLYVDLVGNWAWIVPLIEAGL